MAAGVAGPWLWRRRRPRLRRRRYAHTAPPGTEILARWEQAAAVLARTGLGRRPAETLEEHSARLAGPDLGTPTVASVFTAAPSPLRSDTPGPPGPRRLPGPGRAGRPGQLRPDPCADDDLAEARRLSEELRATLRRTAADHGAPPPPPPVPPAPMDRTAGARP